MVKDLMGPYTDLEYGQLGFSMALQSITQTEEAQTALQNEMEKQRVKDLIVSHAKTNAVPKIK